MADQLKINKKTKSNRISSPDYVDKYVVKRQRFLENVQWPTHTEAVNSKHCSINTTIQNGFPSIYTLMDSRCGYSICKDNHSPARLSHEDG